MIRCYSGNYKKLGVELIRNYKYNRKNYIVYIIENIGVVNITIVCREKFTIFKQM